MAVYGLGLVVFLLLKGWRSGVGVEELRFLLMPTDVVVRGITGAGSWWMVGEGYYYPELDVLLNAGCAGFTFFTICFLVLLAGVPGRWLRWWVLPLCLLVAWPCAVLANAARIVCILTFRDVVPLMMTDGIVHEAQGALVYLVFLVLIYLTVRRLLTPTFSV